MLAVKCPAGTRYEKDSETCVVCSIGTYQELDGQSECRKCQKGFSTHGYKASNYTACKGISASLNPDKYFPSMVINNLKYQYY